RVDLCLLGSFREIEDPDNALQAQEFEGVAGGGEDAVAAVVDRLGALRVFRIEFGGAERIHRLIVKLFGATKHLAISTPEPGIITMRKLPLSSVGSMVRSRR